MSEDAHITSTTETVRSIPFGLGGDCPITEVVRRERATRELDSVLEPMGFWRVGKEYPLTDEDREDAEIDRVDRHLRRGR